jgi:hypothetical protein
VFKTLTILLACMNASSPSYESGPESQDMAEPGRTLSLIESREIWSQAPHNAFTDLLRRGDGLVMAFREGRGHISSDGALRVLSSRNGRDWTPAEPLRLSGFDLRDADLSSAPDGRLLLIGGAAPRAEDNERAPTGTVAAWSADGLTWSEPKIVVQPGRWLWRVSWLGERAFGVSYSAGSGPARIDLLTSTDGVEWETRLENMHPAVSSNETALAFVDSVEGGEPLCVALTRAQNSSDSASIGLAQAPFDHFEWKPLGFQLGGPNLIRTPGGNWVAAGRVLQGEEQRTAVFFIDPETGRSGGMIFLPSGGDTSYPGLAWWDGELLVSYYSSHSPEGRELSADANKSRIYLARVRVAE